MNTLERRRIHLPLVALALLAAVGCSRSEDWNVLLVTFDTTRADHLGCYGNDRIKTPNVDRLAAEGTLFANAYSSVPVTTPSHSTIMTGKYPIGHGVRDNGLFILGDNQVTLAELLRENGWRTGAAIGAFPLIAKFGLNQGFEHYDDRINQQVENFLGERALPKSNIYFDQRTAGRVNDGLLNWIDKNHREPFFAWAHYYDPHQPFSPPAPYDQLYAGRPYEGEIAYSDESFGRLLDRLRKLGVYDRTIIILTADHGEGLDEHNETTHSILIYNTTLHVPLIVKVPGQPAGQIVEESVGMVDILPTVLDALDIESPEGVQGRSLLSHLRGDPPDTEATPRPIYAETLSPRLGFGWGELRALIYDDHKYIFGPRPELYDIASDPNELDNLVNTEAEVAKSMQRRLVRFLRENAADDLAGAVPMDDETRSKLAALGYIGGGGGDEEIVEELRPDGVPPQDRVGDINELSMAKQMLFTQQVIAAQEIIQGLLDRHPDNPTYLEMMATAYLQQGQFEKAVETVEVLRALDQPSALLSRILLQLGSGYFYRGEVDNADVTLNESLALEPTAAAHYLLANVHAARGDLEQKRAALQAALERDPTYPLARVDLAVLHARAGDRERAEAEFRKAMTDHPYFAKTYYNYGVFLVAGGDQEGGVTHLQRTVELEPNYWQAYLALVELHLQLGQEEEARRNARILLDRVPRSPQALQAQAMIEESA